MIVDVDATAVEHGTRFLELKSWQTNVYLACLKRNQRFGEMGCDTTAEMRQLLPLTLEQRRLVHLYYRTLQASCELLGISNEGVAKRTVGDHL